jgi:hypothetical protein
MRRPVEGMCVGPAYLAAGINGLAALSFDGNAALRHARLYDPFRHGAFPLRFFVCSPRDRAYEQQHPTVHGTPLFHFQAQRIH